uniref:HNH endonuclease signature motif containing protein n=1 Tax=Candidatus Electrothrix sp. TaxID=2170559 RepID=UPI0040561532
MGIRANIPQRIKQKLWILTDNVCALPNCREPIYDSSNDTYIGEIAHIEAYSEGGPRYNPNTSQKEKNDYDNLLLVCPKCHKIIDSTDNKYTVEQLRNFKKLQNDKNLFSKENLLQQNKLSITKCENIISETFDFLEKKTDLFQVDSPELWFKTFFNLESNYSYLKRIGLPYATKLVPAFATIIESISPYSIPVIRYLCNRVYIYFAVIDEVCEYYEEKHSFRVLLERCHHKLNELLMPYSRIDQKQVGAVSEAIKKQELAPYRDYWNTTDLRVVLKALHEDKTDGAQRYLLLQFVLHQITIETQKRQGYHIPEPRHAWWAIETLLDEMDRKDVNENLEILTSAIEELLTREFEENFKVKQNAVAPEIHCAEMEDYWGTINMIKLLRISYSNNIPFGVNLLKKIERKVQNNIKVIYNDSNSDSFRVFCVRLIMLHEFQNYINKL